MAHRPEDYHNRSVRDRSRRQGHFVSNGVLGRTLRLFPDVSDGQSGNYLPNQPSVLAAEPSRKQAEPCDFDAFLNYQFGWSLQGIAKQLKGKNF